MNVAWLALSRARHGCHCIRASAGPLAASAQRAPNGPVFPQLRPWSGLARRGGWGLFHCASIGILRWKIEWCSSRFPFMPARRTDVRAVLVEYLREAGSRFLPVAGRTASPRRRVEPAVCPSRGLRAGRGLSIYTSGPPTPNMGAMEAQPSRVKLVREALEAEDASFEAFFAAEWPRLFRAPPLAHREQARGGICSPRSVPRSSSSARCDTLDQRADLEGCLFPDRAE